MSCDIDNLINNFFFILQCTFASKFLTLTESVRDAADLYLSLKYPPITSISDSPCGFTRHVEFGDAEVAEALWSNNLGCFEKPQPNKEPNQLCYKI